MTSADQSRRLDVHLAADRKQICLVNWLGHEARLSLLGPTEVHGSVAEHLQLRSDGLAELDRPARLDLLRVCRRLLVPGGTLSLKPDDWPGQLAQAGWLCGFESEVTTSGNWVTLTRPLRAVRPSPLVSILIPAYKPDHLADSLRSALAQTYQNCEVILCDDSSGSEVETVVRKTAGDRVRYVRNPANLGGQANYLKCFDLARGQYIKFLNDDDVLAPECVAVMAACLDRSPAVTLVTSYRQLIDENGKPLPDKGFNLPMVPCDALFEGRHLATRLLTEQINRIGEPTTAMFRKADLLANRPHLFSYDGTPARRNGDTFVWAALLSRGDAIYLTAPLSGFRQHAAQVQRDPVFVADAMTVWDELADQARTTGLVHPNFRHGPSPFPVRAESWAAGDFDPGRTSPEVISLMEQGKLEAASIWLRSRLQQDPESVRLRGDLGSVLWAWGRHEAGLAETMLAMRRDTDETTRLNLQDMLACRQ